MHDVVDKKKKNGEKTKFLGENICVIQKKVVILQAFSREVSS